MTDSTNFRQERIEKLLQELEYEITRGMLQREIGEQMGFRFFVPISHDIPNGVVFCEFRTRPVPRMSIALGDMEPRLRVVKT